ncbi:PAS domain S-box protein [Polaromonas sp.]|uniref:PAS domain S-box protein n=1 Tax=Polaromonas sp. TaxID=1869339 RepID=UPI002FCC590A
MKASNTLRTRLVILVVAAIVPLFGLSIFKALHNANAAVERALADLQFAASLAASSQQRVSETAHQLLTAIANASDIRDGKAARCEHYLAELRRLFPVYANLGIVGADGYVRCHAVGGSGPMYLGDRAYFREAVARRSFVVGEYIVGRLTGKTSITFALPVLDADGRVAMVAYASLDLAEMAKAVAEIQMPPGAALGIYDRNGTLLARKPGLPVRVGQKAASPVLQEAVKTMSKGVREGVDGADGAGQRRLWAFMPSSPVPDAAFFVAVSIDSDLVVGPGQRQLLLELAMLALLATLGGLIAWEIGGRAIVEPTRQILQATHRLTSGDLDVRIPIRSAGHRGELARIAHGFNLMAASLQQRENDLETELARSRQAYITLELTVNSMQEGLMAVDTAGRLLLINEAASRLFQLDQAPMVLSSQWPQRQGLFVPGTDTLYAYDELPLYKALQGESGGPQHILVRNDVAPWGRLISSSYRPMHGSEGVMGALMVFTDITQLEQLQMEQAKSYAELRETQRKLLDAQRLGRIGNWEFDLQTQRLWWSDEVYELFGQAPGTFDGRHETLIKMIHPDDRAGYEQRRARAIRDGEELDIEYRIITPAGDVRWLHQLGKLHVNDAGQAVYRTGVVQEITQRKQSELAVAHTTDLLHRTGEMAMVGGWEVILDGMRTTNSEQVYRIHDLEPGAPLGLDDAMSFYAPEAQPVFRAAVQAAIENATPWDLELPMITAMGRSIWVRTQGRAYPQDGKVVRLAGAVQDITARKRSELALIDSEQRYAALFETAPVPMWVFDAANQRFLTVNQTAVNNYGYSAQEFLSMTLFDIRSGIEQARLRQQLENDFYERRGPWLHRRKDGSEFPVEVVSQPIQYAGRDARFVVALDLTAQIKAEKDVQEHLFTLQRAADAAQAITWHQTVEATMQETADQARGVVGAHQTMVSLVINQDWTRATSALSLSKKYTKYRDLISTPDGTGIDALVCETNRPMRLAQAELQAHPRWRGFGAHADQHPPMRGWLAVPLMGRNGKNIGLLQLSDKYEGEFTLEDEYVAIELAQLASIAIENAKLFEQINQLNAGLEQKVVERTAALTRQEALFRALAEQAPQVVWTVNPKGLVTYLNRAWFDLVGGGAADWLGLKWKSVVHPEDLRVIAANWRASCRSHAPYEGIRRVLGKDGAYHTMSYKASPVLDGQGEVAFWVGIDADITEIKAIEAALRLSNQELEAFSYSVSHDLRSPLNTIDGFSRLLAKQLDASSSEKVQHYLSRIQSGVAQMGRLIEDLLSLAQVSRVQLRYESVDLSALARDILGEWQARHPERQASIHIDPGLQVQGDGRLIRVVMENLLGNAWKFTSRQDRADIHVGQKSDAAGMPVFFVQDNGAGFDMAYADKLFNAFQRLHAVSEFPGSGVGLASVSRVIKRHGGRVWAQAEPDQGATFFFTLPKPAMPQ